MFDLSLEVLRVVEDSAIASARTMGMGDAKTADHAAVESMRQCLDTIAIDGTIVIGEGERDEAPMLFIGEKVGASKDQPGALSATCAPGRWKSVAVGQVAARPSPPGREPGPSLAVQTQAPWPAAAARSRHIL